MTELARLKVFAVTVESRTKATVYVLGTSVEDCRNTVARNEDPGTNATVLIADNIDVDADDDAVTELRFIDATEVKSLPDDVSPEYVGWTTLGAWELWNSIGDANDNKDAAEEKRLISDLLHGDLPLFELLNEKDKTPPK